jgi:hypothetical protein
MPRYRLRSDRKALREADRLTDRLEELAWSPYAYRPGLPIDRSEVPFSVRIHLLGNVANTLGLTSGDFVVLAVQFFEAVDRLQDWEEAFEGVVRGVFLDGTITTVYGLPMSEFVKGRSVGTVIDIVALVFRAEAWRENVVATRGAEKAEELLDLAPLKLAEMGGPGLL